MQHPTTTGSQSVIEAVFLLSRPGNMAAELVRCQK